MADVDPVRRERDVYRRVAVLLHVLFDVALIIAIALTGGLSAAVVAMALGAGIFGGWAVGLLRAENAVRLREIEVRRSGRPLATGSWAAERPAGPRPSTSLPTSPPIRMTTPSEDDR